MHVIDRVDHDGMARSVLERQMYSVDTGGYRTSDFKYHWKPWELPVLASRIDRFDLYSQRSILQYPFLPHRFENDTAFGIGATPLTKLHNLSAYYAIDLRVKCEHMNPSGSFKDRETLIASLYSKEHGDKIAVGFSSGNATCSAAYVSRMMGQKFVAVVSGDIYPEKLGYILDQGVDVIKIGNDACYFERAYQTYIQAKNYLEFQFNGIDDWSVANPYRVEGNKTMAVEIVKQMGELSDNSYNSPDFIILPTANGSCLSGLWKGFCELHKLGVIKRLPRMVSVGVENASPLNEGFLNNAILQKAKCDLQYVDEADMKIGSTLIAEESYDFFYGVKALRDSNGLVYQGNASDIREAYTKLFQYEVDCMLTDDLVPEPCSMLTLGALEKMARQGVLQPGHSVVVISTGHGYKSRHLINRLGLSEPVRASLNQSLDENRRFDYQHDVRGRLIESSENPGVLAKELYNLIF